MKDIKKDKDIANFALVESPSKRFFIRLRVPASWCGHEFTQPRKKLIEKLYEIWMRLDSLTHLLQFTIIHRYRFKDSSSSTQIDSIQHCSINSVLFWGKIPYHRNVAEDVRTGDDNDDVDCCQMLPVGDQVLPYCDQVLPGVDSSGMDVDVFPQSESGCSCSLSPPLPPQPPRRRAGP